MDILLSKHKLYIIVNITANETIINLYNDNDNNIGYISFTIIDNEGYIYSIFINKKYRSKKYSYFLMGLVAEYMINNNIDIINLDDMSDLNLGYTPSVTKSGKVYGKYESIYIKLGCVAQDEYDYPERICKSNVMLINSISRIN